MISAVRPRTFLVPFALALVGVLLLLIGVAHAATGAASGGYGLPDVTASASRWYADGRLAGPVVLGVYGLLRLALRLSNSRNRRLAWLRGKDRLAAVSSGIAALTVVLPSAIAGSLTWGGLVVALVTGGTMYAGGTAAPVQAPDEDVPS